MDKDLNNVKYFNLYDEILSDKFNYFITMKILQNINEIKLKLKNIEEFLIFFKF